jgi:hypothetical protein
VELNFREISDEKLMEIYETFHSIRGKISHQNIPGVQQVLKENISEKL